MFLDGVGGGLDARAFFFRALESLKNLIATDPWGVLRAAALRILSVGALASVVFSLAFLVDLGPGELSDWSRVLSFALVPFGLVSAGSLTMFLYQRQVRRLERVRYDELFVQVARHAIFGRRYARTDSEASEALGQWILHRSKMESSIVEATVSLLLLFSLTALVVWQEPVAGLAFVAVGATFLLPIITLGRKERLKSSSFFQTESKSFGVSRNALRRSSGHIWVRPSLLRPVGSGRLFQPPSSLARFQDSYDDVQLHSHRLSFYSGLLRALGLGTAILVFFGVSSEADGQRFLVFFGLIYLLSNQAASVIGFLSSANLFLPQVQRLDQFMAQRRHYGEQREIVGETQGRAPSSVVTFGETVSEFEGLIDGLPTDVWQLTPDLILGEPPGPREKELLHFCIAPETGGDFLVTDQRFADELARKPELVIVRLPFAELVQKMFPTSIVIPWCVIDEDFALLDKTGAVLVGQSGQTKKLPLSWGKSAIHRWLEGQRSSAKPTQAVDETEQNDLLAE